MISDHAKTEAAIERAKMHLCFARPYFSKGVYALRVVVTDDVPAMAVDPYWRLYVNPGWVAQHSVGQSASSLNHELQHLLLDHAGRAKAAGVSYSTLHMWNNEAADPEINAALLRDCRSCRPIMEPIPEAWCSLPAHFGLPDGKTAEWYFAERLKALHGRAGRGTVQENGGKGNGGKGSSGKGDGKGFEGELDFGCGSGASGVQAPWDVGSPAESNVDGLDDADVIDIRRQVAKDIVEHAKRSKDIESGLLAWAKGVVEIKTIRWDTLLCAAVRRASLTASGVVTPSYTRLSRRQHAFGRAIAPAYRRPVPDVVLVLDASESMNECQCVVRGVVDGACRSLGVPLRTIDVNTSVRAEVRVTSGREALKRGGGGTDMRAGIAKALEGRADAIVVVTDCETPWPEKVSARRLIVVAVGATQSALEKVPEWATLVVATQKETA